MAVATLAGASGAHAQQNPFANIFGSVFQGVMQENQQKPPSQPQAGQGITWNPAPAPSRAKETGDATYLQSAFYNAMEFSKIGIRTSWTNPSNGDHGEIVPTAAFTGTNKAQCRKYEKSIVVGKTANRYAGTACRSPHGGWTLMGEKQIETPAAVGPGGTEDAAAQLAHARKLALTADVQSLLARLGFDPGPADGRAGPKTIAAIGAYQGQRGLSVDGTVSMALRDRLKDELAARSNGQGVASRTEGSKPPAVPVVPSVSPQASVTPAVTGAKLDAPSFVVPEMDGHRLALVIGNSAYESGRLQNPVNDAKLIAATLRKTGFEVIKVLDATQRQMKRAIQRFGARLDHYGESGVALFYYAGHGVQAGGRNYLIPVDAQIQRETDLEIEGVPADWIVEQLEYARSRLNLIILDACRNNPFSRGFRSVAGGLARMDAPTGTLIAYSTAPGDVAADGNGANSPYSASLARAMLIPGEPVEQAFKEVRVAVHGETKGAQTPWESSSLTGDFYFVPSARQGQR